MSSNFPGETYEKKAAVKNGVGRLILGVIALLLEIFVTVILATSLYSYARWIAVGSHLLATVTVIGLFSQARTASMKMPWIVLILLAPLLGILLYFSIGFNATTRRMRKRFEETDAKLFPCLPRNDDVVKDLAGKDRYASNIARYLQGAAHFPLYGGSEVTYFDDGLAGLKAQIAAMKKAEHFIFMEYHAIEEGKAWNKILPVLEDRVRNGVEVRIFYDDIGSIFFITRDFVKRMEARGIACRCFNPVSPLVNFFLNNRDHRKIMVIDGKVGFTGGYNLADEYFHITKPYGFWKDCAIRIEGEAVRSLTMMFLEMWNAVRKGDADDQDFEPYLPKERYSVPARGFVQPYADSPIDRIQTGEDVYLSMIESAERYIWLMSPYLIITDEMRKALSLAARRGVDVRIVTPGIPDKKIIYQITRSYYSALAKEGVRIFEFKPGFTHSKLTVSDDVKATCGTINLDYRSLYHHFENGCFFAFNDAVLAIREDFRETFPKCEEVTSYYATGRGAFLRIGQLLLRFIAPLL